MMEVQVRKSDIWDEVVSSVERSLNKHIVDSWFRPVKFEDYSAEDRTISLRAGQVTKDWIDLYYSELLKKTLDDLGYGDHSIAWSIDETETAEDRFAGFSGNEAEAGDAPPQPLAVPQAVPAFAK